MNRTYRTEGIIIRRINYGEADRILTFYTKHYGKIKAIAKGVRKLTSRKGGNVELFNHLIIFLARGKNLDILSEIQVLNSFKAKDLKKIKIAYYFSELIDKLTPEKQPSQEVFNLLRDSLKKINQENLPVLIREFEEKLLKELGFGIPAYLEDKKESLRTYIEQVSERKINSQRFLHDS